MSSREYIEFSSRSRPRRLQLDHLLSLQAAAQRITSILDMDVLLDEVVNDIAVAFGCRKASIWLADTQTGDMVLSGLTGFYRFRKGDRLHRGEGMIGCVAATGRMRYAPDVRQDLFYIACDSETSSEVDIPLKSRGELIGVFSASHVELDAFSPDRLKLLQILADYIAIAIENAQLFEHERLVTERLRTDAEEARLIQQALLPTASPYVPGYTFEALSLPSREVGGDWYDYIPLEDGKLCVVLGDVSGKGSGAAMLMAATRSLVRAFARQTSRPSELLSRVNEAVLNQFPEGKLITMIIGVLSPEERIFVFANAGHPWPQLVNGAGAICLQTEFGFPLGFKRGHFSERTVDLDHASRLVIYSDGLTESVNSSGEEFGIERVCAHLAGTAACADSLVRELRLFCGSDALTDDATMVMVKAA